MDNTSKIYYYEFVGPAYLDLVDQGNLYGYGVVEIQLLDGRWTAYYEDKEIIRIGPAPETVFVNGVGDFRVSYHVSSCEAGTTAVWGTHVGDGTIGPAGPAGTDGEDGATGATGPAGADGPAGVAGADSTVPGPTGATGPAGTDGTDGADGLIGATGPAGVDGSDGAVGPAGPSGSVGYAPKAGFRNAVVRSQVFDDTIWTVVNIFDTIVVERGGITADIAANSITIGATAHHEIRFGLNVDFNGSEDLQLVPAVNGVLYSDNPLEVHGAGTDKAVSLYWVSEVDLVAGDVITIHGKNGAVGSLTVNVLRSTFMMTQDGVPV